jgi:general secretion pathway protein L
MSSYRAAAEAVSRWIDQVAATVVETIECFRPRHLYRLVEQEDGAFVLQGALQSEVPGWPGRPFAIFGEQADPAVLAKLGGVLHGSQVELILLPKHFMFRQLELPRRAAEFLDGIVRAQIDRLTPWSTADAAFGWHPSAQSGTDRMAIIIAATARTLIAPFVSAISAFGVDLITVSAALDEPQPDIPAIKVGEHKIGKAADLRRVRRILAGLLSAAGVLSSVSVMASVIAGGAIEARRDDVASRIAERRATLQSGHDKMSTAALGLERRKHETPSSAIVIEALSRILPDDTYLTELRILGDKVQIVGITHDAPALIRLIEQTSHFTKATFFAPTTRTKAEPGEHFSIEAHIEPVYKPDP